MANSQGSLGDRKGEERTESGGPINQLKSSTAGFIVQLKGKLTTQRYRYATVFVDQHLRYAYVYLQWTITSAETVQAKHSFEHMAEDMGVRIHHYHADNGDLRIRASSRTARSNIKGSHIAESMPTSKTALRGRRSAISRNRRGR